MPNVRCASTAVILALVGCCGGCALSSAVSSVSSTAGSIDGGFTLFPANNFLMETTREVMRGIPRSTVVPRELQKTVLPAYVVQPGDAIALEPITTKPAIKLVADQTVMPDGTIDLGGFGRVVVAGKTLEDIEREIDSAITSTEHQEIHVNVRLSKANSAVYYVMGEVNAPGAYPLTGHETVLDAIAAAKGLNARASPCRMILARPTHPMGCRVVVPICFRQIVQLGDTSTNYQLMPGDRVFVASQSLCEQLFPFARKGCRQCRGLQCPCPDPVGSFQTPTQPSYILPSSPVVSGSVSAPETVPAPTKPAGKK